MSIVSDFKCQGGFDFGMSFTEVRARPRLVQEIILFYTFSFFFGFRYFMILFFRILSIIGFSGVSVDWIMVFDN